jgi:hypothetical protein
VEISINTVFPSDNVAVLRILNTLKPLYMQWATGRAHIPEQGDGDVTVQDGSHDLFAALRVVPPGMSGWRTLERVAECFLKKYKSGGGKRATEWAFTSSRSTAVKLYEEYPV